MGQGFGELRFSRKQTVVILFIAAMLFGFTLFQASWLADKPMGRTKLVADRAAEPVRDAAGCVASANSGFGGTTVGPDIAALQVAAGSGASAIRVTTQLTGGALRLASQFESDCPADKTRAAAQIAEAVAGMTKPELFWQIEGGKQANLLLAELTNTPGAMARSIVFGDDAAVAAIRKAQPDIHAFSVNGARACASDYRVLGIWGSVPASCKNSSMLLKVSELGFTLWGWPNRFLARMEDANVRLIIAEDVVDGQVKGLTDVNQYGDIADSYNGYIWVDNIEELGPALRR